MPENHARKKAARNYAATHGLSYVEALRRISENPEIAAVSVLTAEPLPVHKARPGSDEEHCGVCFQRIKKVPGGQGPTWVHAETGAVAAPGADPTQTCMICGQAAVMVVDAEVTLHGQVAPVGGNRFAPMRLALCAEHRDAYHPEAAESTTETTADASGEEAPSTAGGLKRLWLVAHEGNRVPRCTGTSWRGGSGQKAGQGYGPGGYNRCVKAAGHSPVEGGNDPHHVDEWGNLFRTEPSFKVLRNIGNEEMANVAREAGMHVSDGSDMEREDPLPKPNTLWMTGGQGGKEMVKVSNHYGDEQRLSATVVYPVPPRTTVRFYFYTEVRAWKEPTEAQMRRYERAWGFTS